MSSFAFFCRTSMGEDVNNYEEIIFDQDDDDEDGGEGEEGEVEGGAHGMFDTHGYESSSSDEFLEVPINDVSVCRRK